jgi:hypothetical protein
VVNFLGIPQCDVPKTPNMLTSENSVNSMFAEYIFYEVR